MGRSRPDGRTKHKKNRRPRLPSGPAAPPLIATPGDRDWSEQRTFDQTLHPTLVPTDELSQLLYVGIDRIRNGAFRPRDGMQ
mgnify:CR=1 FL=1